MSPSNSVSRSYRGLAAFFLPIHVLEERAREGRIEEILASEYCPCPRLAEEYSRLLAVFQECLESEECRKSLENEHTLVLYEGPGGPACPPYESVYKIRYGRRQVAMPGVVADLRRYYQALGVEARGTGGLTEDHASVELEFASLLWEVRQRLSEEGDPDAETVEELRREFARRHLVPLVLGLARCIRRSTRHPVLLQLARALEEVAACEALG